MTLIDIDKFLASFITEMKKYQPVTCYNLPGCIKKALEDQGLEYKDGEIVKSQRRVSAEAKENGYGESEEEKIRKALIELFKVENFNRYITLNGIDVDDVIAWLEKQGQKPVWSKKDEETVTGIINDIQERLESYPTEQLADIYFKEIKWLKSIKERIGGDKV